MEELACYEKGVSNVLTFYLNGNKVVLPNSSFNPDTTLLQYVRSIGLTGSKLGCGEGGCGACSILISSYNNLLSKVEHKAVNGCLTPLCVVDGCAVTTVEGLGSTLTKLGPVQERIANANGSQCGFCTPGIVVALHASLRGANGDATPLDIEESFDGNLCRCTGYRPILDAAKTFATKTCDGCKITENCTDDNPVLLASDQITSKIAFPTELKEFQPKPLCFTSTTTGAFNVTWYRPLTLNALLQLKQKFEQAKIVVGNTELGIETKILGRKYPVMISPHCIPELTKVTISETGITIGGAVSLNNLYKRCNELCARLPEHQQRLLKAIAHQLKWFAGNQIRNVACVGGNIATASPISDLNPVWIAAGSVLHIASATKVRTVPIREFFESYRKTVLQANEVIVGVETKWMQETEHIFAFKQARRRDDDIAIVTSAMRVLLEKSNDQWQVKDCGLGFGGMAAITVSCPKTEAALVGKAWNSDILDVAYPHLGEELELPPTAPGGMVKYRLSLTTSFFYKFYLKVTNEVKCNVIDAREISAIQESEKFVSKAKQEYPEPDKNVYPVNAPIKHVSSAKQVSGEALYVDDIPNPRNGLHAAFVLSRHAHAFIKSDLQALKQEVLQMKENGKLVEDFIIHSDVPGSNDCSTIPMDANKEQLFATNKVEWYGQPIGLIVAHSHDLAMDVARKIEAKIQYQDTDEQGNKLPFCISTRQAIEQNSFFGLSHEIDFGEGDIEEALKKCDTVIEGEMEIGAQEHFYLETNGTFAEVGEGHEMIIHASSQNPTKTQYIVAKVLGIPSNRVISKVKRVGGGFGGKENRSIFISAAAAVAAKKLHKPVRLILDRQVDMVISGQRHPFLGKYRVGATKAGKIEVLDVQLFSNAGFCYDLSLAVMDRALFHVDNCYKIPRIRCVGKLCKTNIASNTAFRGFGGPQSMLICEHWVEQLANKLQLCPNKLRELNFYHNGDITHYKQAIEHCRIEPIWNGLLESATFEQRLKQVNEFNKQHKWRKRGIAIIPTKFGMSFTVKFMNQAGALVHCYTDGTVLVSHGGIEMGQGLHTKICQIAANALGIPLESVHITETATDKVANTSPTAASVQSDMNGMAVLNACNIINERLEPLKKANPTKSFQQIVQLAYMDRINLSANGYYATPQVGYEFDGTGGRPFNYFAYGAACSEVEIDTLTGDYQTLRADILMDVGKSLNPAIDIGQVEGAFVQGTGWCTTEEVVFFKSGRMFTKGPGAYKIPGFNDVPKDFRVSLLKDAPNERAIHSSKGVGEPPFFLATSVFFAIKNAIAAARKENNLEEFFTLNSPATAERIRLACADSFTKQVC